MVNLFQLFIDGVLCNEGFKWNILIWLLQGVIEELESIDCSIWVLFLLILAEKVQKEM